jgi:hypothetical protein
MEEIITTGTQTPNLNNDLIAVNEPKKRMRRLVAAQEKSAAPAIIPTITPDVPVEMSIEEKKRQSMAEARARLRKEWEIESQRVTGVFRDLEVGPGGNIKFSALKYPWDKVENFDLKDGYTYTVPLWVARHLNENCKWPVYKHNIDPNAREGDKVKQYVNQYNHRFAFISSDFTNIQKPEMGKLVY